MGIRYVPLLAAALVVAGCQGEAQADRVPLGAYGGQGGSQLPADLQVYIDSGNAAYRAKDYEGALRYYQEAAERNPDEATPWFGISMAAGALGDTALADSAQRRVHGISPELSTAGHGPAMEAPTAPPGLPPGHP